VASAGGDSLMKTVEEIKAAIEAAVPGAGVEIVLNSGPSAQHSLRLAPEHAVRVAHSSATMRNLLSTFFRT